MLDSLNKFVPIAMFALAVGSMAAATAAWYAVVTSRAALRMQILLDFAKRDASRELGVATKQLYDFRSKGEEDFVARFAQLRNNADNSKDDKDTWEEIDNARRIVHKFWIQLMHVRFAGLISDDQIITFFVRSQLETVVNILEPLEREKPGAAFTKVLFKRYRKLLKEYDQRFERVFKEEPSYEADNQRLERDAR